MTQENTAIFATANAKAKLPSDIDEFAAACRLKVRRDECGDPIIRGKRGHLYFDGPNLCAMLLDTPPIARRRLAAFAAADAQVWQGDISPDRTGRRVQDIEIRSIRPECYRVAIQLVRARPKRVLSEAQRLRAEAALQKARAARIATPCGKTACRSVERAASPGDGVGYRGVGLGQTGEQQ